MYPQHYLNEFIPPHLRSLLGVVESRASPAITFMFSKVLSQYSLFDLTTRLPELIRNDIEIVVYLQCCTHHFASVYKSMFPHQEHARLRFEIDELQKWLELRRKLAMNPARL